MSKYHRILGVPSTASKAQIKRAYRDLAKKLHPDKNPSPNADDQFAALQEAYDFLMDGPDPSQSSQSNSTHSSNASSSNSNYQSAEERIRVARERLRFQEERERENNERYFQKLVNGPRGKFVRIGAIICLIVAIAFTLDSLMPHHIIPDKIDFVTNSIGEGRLRPGEQVIYTQDGEVMELVLVNYSWGEAQLNINIEKTWFLHIPISVTQKNQKNKVAYPIFREFWQKAPLPNILFFVPAILLFYQKRTATFTGLYMASFYICIPLTLLFLVGHFRWVHILTLGFV